MTPRLYLIKACQ